MRSFGELLAEHIERTGITDAELARNIGVQRQTIFRWKEGLVARPRYREDVLRIATKLRLTPDERDELLLAGGFPPENPALWLRRSPPASDSERAIRCGQSRGLMNLNRRTASPPAAAGVEPPPLRCRVVIGPAREHLLRRYDPDKD